MTRNAGWNVTNVNDDGDGDGDDQNLRIRSAIPIAIGVVLAIGGLVAVTSYVVPGRDDARREVPMAVPPPAAMPLATQPVGGDGVIRSMRFDSGLATAVVLDTTQWEVDDPVLIMNPGRNVVMTRGIVKHVLPANGVVQVELAPMSNGGWPPLIGHIVQRIGDAATRPSSAAATQPTTAPEE